MPKRKTDDDIHDQYELSDIEGDEPNDLEDGLSDEENDGAAKKGISDGKRLVWNL